MPSKFGHLLLNRIREPDLVIRLRLQFKSPRPPIGFGESIDLKLPVR